MIAEKSIIGFRIILKHDSNREEITLIRTDCWTLARIVVPVSKRTLLYGPPGTGKTFAGQNFGVEETDDIFNLYLTEYTPVNDIRGGLYPTLSPNGERKFEWMDGPALAAYRNGGRLIINEINQASDDCITFLLALLDDERVSKITLSTGEVVTPHPNFSVVATMNAEPQDLLEALKDRFPVSIRIDTPNPEAVSSLPYDLHNTAKNTVMLPEERRVGMRQWFTYATLREQIGPDMAGQACFGLQAEEILNAMQLSALRG